MDFDQYLTANALRMAYPEMVARSARYRLDRFILGDEAADGFRTPELAAWMSRYALLLKTEARAAREAKRAVSVHRKALRGARKRAAANDTCDQQAA